MAFTVEDGTGIDGANSYGSVADADAYFTDRGNGVWVALSTPIKQSCLIKATDYIDQRFGDRFIGYRYADDQNLAWPRSHTGTTLLNDTIIPLKLQYACFEYAYRASIAALAPDPVYDSSGAQTVKTREKVGPIEVENTIIGGDFASRVILRAYPGADMYLRGLVSPAGGVYR